MNPIPKLTNLNVKLYGKQDSIMTEIGASSITPKTAKASVSKKVDEDFKNGPIAEVDEDEAEVQNKRLVEESNKNKELEFENRRLAHELA